MENSYHLHKVAGNDDSFTEKFSVFGQSLKIGWKLAWATSEDTDSGISLVHLSIENINSLFSLLHQVKKDRFPLPSSPGASEI
ncbi:MAG: hypothetical protein GY726_13220 [Proteobacteria bacterium]|nr:hypothetical protein [Pseudomonadota bacterium]